MGITHLSGLEVAGVPTMGTGGLLPFTGNYFFVDYYRGSDGNTGAADSPLQTLYQAQNLMQDGHNDVAIIVPSPLSTSASNGTQRLSTAIAQTITPAATTGTLTWAKSACHIYGLTGPTVNPRARIAPPATYTAATFGATTTPLVDVTAQGCIFANFEVYCGFSTNSGNATTAWKDEGGRNYYFGVTFDGMNDATAAASTSSRSLLISGNVGEKTFERCTIGGDTTSRGAGTISLELTGGSPRNKFIDCDFPSLISSATGTVDVKIGVGGIDRWIKFRSCVFMNAATAQGGTTMTGAVIMDAAPGGLALMKDCTLMNITHQGYDSNTRTVQYVDGAVPTGATTGIAVVSA